MKTTEEKIEIMQAYEDGKEIECEINSAWYDVTNPNWNWDICDYRIKEEPKRRALTQQEFLELGVMYVECLNYEYMRAYKVDPNGFYCENYITFKECLEDEITGINYKGEKVNLWKEGK